MARDWCPSQPEDDCMARYWCPSRPERDDKALDWCPRQPELVYGNIDFVIMVWHHLLCRQTAQNDVDLSILEFDPLPRQFRWACSMFLSRQSSCPFV